MDESQHMAAYRCSRVHLLRANPQLANRRPCSSGRCLQEFIRFCVLEKNCVIFDRDGKISPPLRCTWMGSRVVARRGHAELFKLPQDVMDAGFALSMKGTDQYAG